MQVYEGLNHIADIAELNKRDVMELQTSVKVLALQKRDRTASFVEEYASYIVGSVQREAEAIDDNDLEVHIAFPMLEGGVLRIKFTGVNMDELKYMQLHRALVLRIAGIAERYYVKLGRDMHMTESVEFNKVAQACAELYEATEKEYVKYGYQDWSPDFAVKMKNRAKDKDLQILCWAVDTTFSDKLDLRGRTLKKQVVSGLDLRDERGVIDTLVGVMVELVSDYSYKDSIIYLEAADLGIIWLIKPESARMDGSLYISEVNMLQMRYLVTEAISSLGWYLCSKLSEYALVESMDVVGRICLLST